MTRQRSESAKTYEEAGRIDLAERELEEITVIEEFLPRQLDDDEVDAAIDAAITTVGAASIRDMGKVMGELKGKYTGQMDSVQLVPKSKANYQVKRFRYSLKRACNSENNSTRSSSDRNAPISTSRPLPLRVT